MKWSEVMPMPTTCSYKYYSSLLTTGHYLVIYVPCMPFVFVPHTSCLNSYTLLIQCLVFYVKYYVPWFTFILYLYYIYTIFILYLYYVYIMFILYLYCIYIIFILYLYYIHIIFMYIYTYIYIYIMYCVIFTIHLYYIYSQCIYIIYTLHLIIFAFMIYSANGIVFCCILWKNNISSYCGSYPTYVISRVQQHGTTDDNFLM